MRDEGPRVRAAAIVWSIGLELDEPSPSSTRRIVASTAARARNARRGASSAIRCRYLRRCCRSGSCKPAHFSGRGRSAFVSIAQRWTNTLNSPFRVVPTRPVAPTMSPRSTSWNEANTSAGRSRAFNTSCRSPSRSRSVANTSLPMSRLRTTRPATVTTSSVTVSAPRAACAARTAPVRSGVSTPSTSVRVIANAAAPSRSRLARRAASTSASRPVVSPVGIGVSSSVIDVLLIDEAQASSVSHGS